MDETIKLSSTITIGDYMRMEGLKDRGGLAAFVSERLSERYVLPVAGQKKHGFAMMAMSCLLIETLESFREGWSRTDKNDRSKKAFRSFFQREKAFSAFGGLEDAFYGGVRSSILHQGETTKGWRVTRRSRSPLFEPGKLVINADKFFKGVDFAVNRYSENLKVSEWNDPLWENFRKKMDAIIKHCEKEP